MVRRLNTPIVRVFSLIVFAFAFVPAALAREASAVKTGLSPLNKVVGLMAWMFNVPILENPAVQLGFTRFLLFVLFLAVARFAFKKAFDNKTAGIMATVFSLIAAFLMPASLVMANGGVIMVVFTGLIPLGVIGYGIHFCVTKLGGKNGNFATRLIGMVILFTLLMVVEVYHNILDAATPVGPVALTAISILRVLLDWLDIIIIFVIIYMIINLFTGGEGFSGLKNLFSGGDNNGGSGRGSSSNNRSGKNGTKDGGDNNGPKDTSKDYPEWKDGFGTVSVWVTDIDDNPIDKAHVTVVHEKISALGKKMKGYTGPKGTYGPMSIPAGHIMVKATHRNFFQYAIAALLGAGVGMAFLSTDRYAMKDWYFLQKDGEELFHIRLKRKKGQKDHAFEPKIIDVKLKESTSEGDKSRLIGGIE